mgnify:CR=1 FL=1
MNSLAALRSALRALAANTLRSILTMLGIIIGVAAVITMIAVGQGATDRVQEQMKGLGSNIMLVIPGGITAGGVRLGAQTGQGLTEEDALAIGREVPEVQAAAPTLRTRLQTAMRSGFGDMVDHTAPWILVGLIIAALLGPLMEGSWMTRLPAGVDVLLFAAIGLPLYVCASASTPLVAVLVAAGVSPGAGLALLITGPATNMATIGILSRLHGARFAYAFAAAMIVAAITVGLLVNVALPAASMPTLSQSSLDRTSPLELLSAITLAALYAASVLRRGARGFLGELRMSQA